MSEMQTLYNHLRFLGQLGIIKLLINLKKDAAPTKLIIVLRVVLEKVEIQ